MWKNLYKIEAFALYSIFTVTSQNLHESATTSFRSEGRIVFNSMVDGGSQLPRSPGEQAGGDQLNPNPVKYIGLRQRTALALHCPP
jgi:hypothetical protein